MINKDTQPNKTGDNDRSSDIETQAETGSPEQWRESVPNDLKDIDRWLMWDASADTPRRPHWKGDFSVSYSNEENWHTFDEAVEAAQEKDSWGIGFVTGDDVAVIDVDGAAEFDEAGRPHPKEWVPSLGQIKRAAEGDVYIEWSPSETGLHIPVKNLDSEWWTDVSVEDAEHEGVDVLQGLFCTVTGNAERGFDGGVVEFGPKLDFWLRDARENIDALNGGDELANGGDGWKPDEEWLTEDDIRDALSHIDADCAYPKWRDIGFAVAEFFYVDEKDRGDEYDTDEDREKAVEVFRDWSQTADEKWDAQAEEQCERIVVGSLSRIPVQSDPVTVGTLIAYAKNAGWEMPDPPESVKAAAAKDTIAEFIDAYDPVDDRPEKPDLTDDDIDEDDPEVQAVLDAWPSGTEKSEVAYAIVDLSDQDYRAVKGPLLARLERTGESTLDKHRDLRQAVREESGSLVNYDGELVKVKTGGRWATCKTVLNFELDVNSLLSVEGEDRMANVEVRPSEPSESEFELQIEPRVFNDIRRFKDEVLSKRFSTTIEVDWLNDDVMDALRKYVSRQDVPRLTGQKQMGLAWSGDEFVLPTGVLDADGWDDDPETVYVERDVGAERKVKADPVEHDEFVNRDVAEMIELFTRTRDPERFVPVLGWFYAAPFRPEIIDRADAFNLLFATGDSGVGKTGTLGVASRMFGMSSEPFSCSDTTFATITTLASSRGVPVWLDEYKESEMADWQKNKLHELLRKAATGGVEQRGNADKTTDEYHLRAPVVVSGETRVRGSAEQRRAIDVAFRDEPTNPDTDEYQRFKRLVGDAVTDENGNVTFPDARYELEEHAVAYYSYVASTDQAEFENVWFGAREYVSKRLAQWDVELDDMEIQGLQTVVFGFRVMRGFAESVGADLSKLPGEDELDTALRYIADVDGVGRETHVDQFLSLCSRAAVAEYLEEDTHYTIVREDKSDEEIRINVTRAFDAVSRYVRDHDLSEDLLGSAQDYSGRFKEAVNRDGDDEYVVAYSQPSPPVGRAVGIQSSIAEERIDGFSAGSFKIRDDEESEFELSGSDDDDGHNGVVTVGDISEEWVDDRVGVNPATIVDWTVLENSNAHAVGTLSNGDDEVNMIAFESQSATIDAPEKVRLSDVVIGEYDGEVQLQLDRESRVDVFEDSDDDQDTLDDDDDDSAREDGETAVRAGGGDGVGDTSSMPQEQRVVVVKNLIEQAKMDDVETGADEEAVLDAVENRGISRDAAQRTVSKLKQQGEVYEASPGVLRTT